MSHASTSAVTSCAADSTDADAGAVAVIGLGARLPGAPDVESYWRLLCDLHVEVQNVPGDRWDWRAHFGDTQRDASRSRVIQGAFLPDMYEFDAAFFSLSPREVEFMDPQHRLLLEATWVAVEDAGYAMKDLSERYRVGVFAGLSSFDYLTDYAASGADIVALAPTGMVHAVAANRISYMFNFHGPSEIVDTACSSALVALHRARMSIVNGECDCAIVGAAHAILNPVAQVAFAKAGMLSESGACRTFDARADGYVRGEGGGAVLLKSLAKAREDGDHIYGVIRGTAVNHCGRSHTLTSPNAFAQSAVIQSALASAGVAASTISYVEAHGTGTPKGDPAEVIGLKRAFSRSRSPEGSVPCGLGTAKTNIGHLEGAAGIAGLIKVMLCLKRQTLPGLANFEQLNPLIDFKGSPFYIVEKTQPWPRPSLGGKQLPLRAGVSSFGFGGSNAHAVVEEFARGLPSAEKDGEGEFHILPLSAPTPSGLDSRAQQLAGHLAASPDGGSLADVAFTLQRGREAFSERLIVVARCASEAEALLGQYLQQERGAREALLVSDQVRALPSWGEAAGSDILHKLSEWIAGRPMDWSDACLRVSEAGRRVALPTYTFQRTRYALSKKQRAANGSRLHRLLDENVSTFQVQRFRKAFDPQERLIKDHDVDGVGLVAPSVLLGMMHEAAVRSLGHDRVAGLVDVEWLRPWAPSLVGEVAVDLEPVGEGVVCAVVSDVGSGTTVHATARVLLRETSGESQDAPTAIDLDAILSRLSTALSGQSCTDKLRASGLELGETFRSLDKLHVGEGEALAWLSTPFIEQSQGDAALPLSLVQGAFSALAAWQDGPSILPSQLRLIKVHRRLGDRCLVHMRRVEQQVDMVIADVDGAICLEAHGLVFPAHVAVTAASLSQDQAFGGQVDGPQSATMSDDDLAASLRAYLIDIIATVTKLPLEQADASQSFDHFGFDSTLAMEVTAAIESACGPLPKTLFFQYTNINDLAVHLLEKHRPALHRFFIRRAANGVSFAIPRVPATASAVREPAKPHRFATQGGPASSVSGASLRALNDEEPIAVIGIAGRYPKAQTLQDFWRNIASGLDLIVTVPPERWDMDAYFDPQKGAPGKTYCKWGAFLDDALRFDATVFNISPIEARVLDPQERQFLEVAWSTLEDAGYAKTVLAKKTIGVFVGVMWGHHQMVDPSVGCEWFPSASFASIANRVSYYFDWIGPSVAVDTMCASSLSSIHMACKSLRQGECEMALAGGVNLTLHINKYLQLSQSRFMASHGRCKSFGAGADGFVPGEGVGSVLLKPLSKALADGDFVHAVIRGSATNHGGKTNGYTMPNPRAQAAVVREALSSAGLTSDQVQYIEAHGTGTALGDPIEIAGLDEVFPREGDHSKTIHVGSVKSNMGHLESAAGIAGLTKVVLQMRHQKIAPSIHSAQLNPAIEFDKTRFKVPQATIEWTVPVTDSGKADLRRAGVSSFGAGGVNVHLLVEEFAPQTRAYRDAQALERWASEQGVWILLSAPKAEQLQQSAVRLCAFLDAAGEWSRLRHQHGLTLLDLAWTLHAGRETLAHRLALFVRSDAELRMKLSAFVSGESDIEHVWKGRAASRALHPDPSPSEQLSWAQTVARTAGWVEGRDAAPVQAAMAGIQLRRVPLPTLVFMGSRHWIGPVPTSLPAPQPKEHSLFRKLTVQSLPL